MNIFPSIAPFRRTCLPLVAAPLGACYTMMHPTTEPVVPAGHHFSYRVSNDDGFKLVQAFDDSSPTYLQFDATPSGPIEIRQATTNVEVRF